MKIELKNIKYFAPHSQETHCFEATVYIDGQRAFGVNNDGWGGPNNYFPVDKKSKQNEIYKKVQAINAELEKEEIPIGDGNDRTVKKCMEIVVGNLMNKHLAVKEAKKMLKKISYADTKGNLYSLPAKYKPSDELFKAVKKAKWWKKSFVLLNTLSAEEIAEKYLS